MTKQRGKLYLLPSPISEEGIASIPPDVISLLHRLDYLIVEKARTARRYISATKPARSIDSIHIEEMDGGPQVVPNKNLLQPAIDGYDMGLLSEAGLPAIADPGNMYVRAAHQAGIEVIPMGGPSSLLMALMASGLEGQRFAFHGYLSAKKQELPGQLKELERRADKDNATQLFIETPYRNMQILEMAANILEGKRMFCIAAGLGNANGFVLTKDITTWKKTGWPSIHKSPAVFLLR